ncbi:hypothetical protein A2U01_0057642, partial [Trifolium medium]|nr:hypothetical protein [Trifolium medium]
MRLWFVYIVGMLDALVELSRGLPVGNSPGSKPGATV